MGATPRNDLRVMRTAEPYNGRDASGWHLIRIEPDGTQTSLRGPVAARVNAIVAWRIANDRPSPRPATLAEWILAHVDGFCAGDEDGCPLCADIAAQGPGAPQDERDALANRRQLPYGIGNGVWPDPDLRRRADRLIDRETEGRP
jgi:hypothetical protein